MKRYIYRNNAFVNVTTRRANHSNYHFGKFTFWKSKLDYDKGNCSEAKTYSGICLGNWKADLPREMDRFVVKILGN